MYAIVEIAGLQYKVQKDRQLFVHRLQGEAGDSVKFDRVLLVENGSIQVGAPAIDGMTVDAKIIEHLKGDKVIVFKKKRRKGYKKKNGHRQYLTRIEITAIGGESSDKKEEKKAAPKQAKKDDLTVVEGIGPKVEELLINKGITTFKALAASSFDELRAILDEQEGVYLAMDPTTWPQQAQLAADGKMDELKTLQSELDGGRIVNEEE
ncbi:MAG: 50S ribosomal protein L21 [Weeksellaceae bacterium]|nr:50S ribosomal protein L21 [Weeksellaceae bacterium]